MGANSHLLQVEDLKTYFSTFEGVAKAVDDVTFHVDKGEVLGIVGESGCGKSVTAQSIMRLIPEPPGKIVQGQILFDRTDIVQLSMEQMRAIRGKRIAMIFQEPMTSLNPVFRVGAQIVEAIRLHQELPPRQAWEKTVELLRMVGIPSPEIRARDYPHQMSGGMRQRAMIAMAFSCRPKLLIADEPTTALDVTIQAQILDLMQDMKTSSGSAVMFITHDLGIVAENAQRVVVMYAGRVVESASVKEIFNHPLHPYTVGLLESIPRRGQRSTGRGLPSIPGIVPSLLNIPPGCKFCTRCSQAEEICSEQEPQLLEQESNHRESVHQVRCWKYH